MIDGMGAPAFVAEADQLAAHFGARFAPPDLVRKLAAGGGRFHPFTTPARAAA